MKITSIIGVDIGGTKIGLCRATPEGRVERTTTFPTYPDGPGPQACETTLAQIEAGIAALAPGAAPAIGISCGGPLDARTGLICGPPNLPGWGRVPIVERLTRRFGGQAWLMNDANAGALAEWRHGAGVGVQTMAFLTYGTGMGSGLIIDGRLFEGANGNAGEVGHLRLSEDGPMGYGKAGSFEGWCSGGGLGRLAQAEARARGGDVAFNPGRIEDITARHLAEAAEAGDPLACALFARSGRRLGQALALIIDLINPERIVLGSVYRRARHLLEPAMAKVLAQEALPETRSVCDIVPAALGEDTGHVAACCVALHHLGRFKDSHHD